MEPDKKNAAISLAKGPAGEILSKFAAHYAKAFIFGEKPVKGKNAAISNGTVTLICLPERKVAITCRHVIEGYRNFLAHNKNVVAQIGDTLIDPLSQLSSVPTFFRGERAGLAHSAHQALGQVVDVMALSQTRSSSRFVEFHKGSAASASVS